MANQLNYGASPPDWPYPVNYGKENRIETDVLIIGAGIAGVMAGLRAARRGVKVAVIDKAPIEISGSGGAGIDHYGSCNSNPDSGITPEEQMEMAPRMPGRTPDHRSYIVMKGSWDNLLELERLGMRFRDEDDEFAGAPFRDDKTKIMYAYDYKNKTTVKLRSGADIKRYAKLGLQKEKTATLYERIMITNLLTENGKAGARVVGATGLHEETGEFYVFHAKCAILNTSGVSMQGTGTWTFNSEMFGNGYRADPRNTGDGLAMAWKAGAEFGREERFGQNFSTHPFGWPWYGIGNCDNTWAPCNIVDNNGKEIPWVDKHGNTIIELDMRSNPAPGDREVGFPRPNLTLDLADRIRSGEFELPFWADLSGMPEDRRRCIWGLMVGNEGRTRTAIYDYFNKAGFNPDTDMLQSPVMAIKSYEYPMRDWYQGEPNAVKPWKADTLQGLLTDWNMMTNIEGLFASGCEAGQGGSPAGAGGGYAGNRAAEYAKTVQLGKISEDQVAAEKERIYAPVKRMGDPNAVVSWKELWMGMNRVMQQDLGDDRTRVLCEHGLMWLDSIKRQEMHMTYARNPHELARVLEAESRVTIGEIYFHLCMANFDEAEGAGEDKVMVNKFKDGKVVTTYKEEKWWLKPPYAPTYLENYEKLTALEKEGK